MVIQFLPPSNLLYVYPLWLYELLVEDVAANFPHMSEYITHLSLWVQINSLRMFFSSSINLPVDFTFNN